MSETKSTTPPAGVPELPAKERTTAVSEKVTKALGGSMLPSPSQVGPPRTVIKADAVVEKPRVGLLDGPDPLIAKGQENARKLQTAFANFVRTAQGTLSAHAEYAPSLAEPSVAANVAVACDFDITAADAFVADLRDLLAKHGLA